MVIKCLERFHKKFELKKALPNWPHRGHPLFPEGISYNKQPSRTAEITVIFKVGNQIPFLFQHRNAYVRLQERVLRVVFF